MNTTIFLDTEFTNLFAPELLSVGLVTEHGREFYAELCLESDAGKARFATSSDFVQTEVFNMWERVAGATCTHLELGSRTARWLAECAARSGGILTIAFDYKADWELLTTTLEEAGAWQQLAPLIQPANVSRLTETIEGAIGADAAFAEMAHRDLYRHHALADAMALRGAYTNFMAMTRRSQRGSVTCQRSEELERKEGGL